MDTKMQLDLDQESQKLSNRCGPPFYRNPNKTPQFLLKKTDCTCQTETEEKDPPTEGISKEVGPELVNNEQRHKYRQRHKLKQTFTITLEHHNLLPLNTDTYTNPNPNPNPNHNPNTNEDDSIAMLAKKNRTPKADTKKRTNVLSLSPNT